MSDPTRWLQTAVRPVEDMVEQFPVNGGAFLQEYIDEHHDFLSWLGTRVDFLEDERTVMTIPYEAKLTNAHSGVREGSQPEIHGGIAATLIDTAVGEVVRSGGSVGVSEVRVESETDEGVRKVATGQGSYRLFR